MKKSVSDNRVLHSAAILAAYHHWVLEALSLQDLQLLGLGSVRRRL